VRYRNSRKTCILLVFNSSLSFLFSTAEAKAAAEAELKTSRILIDSLYAEVIVKEEIGDNGHFDLVKFLRHET
jgi:hypothetical protein